MTRSSLKIFYFKIILADSLFDPLVLVCKKTNLSNLESYARIWKVLFFQSNILSIKLFLPNNYQLATPLARHEYALIFSYLLDKKQIYLPLQKDDEKTSAGAAQAGGSFIGDLMARLIQLNMALRLIVWSFSSNRQSLIFSHQLIQVWMLLACKIF